jgi:hypothetical protein
MAALNGPGVQVSTAARSGEQVAADCGHIDGVLPDRLAGVDEVQQILLPAVPPDLGDRLDQARVGRDVGHGHQPRAVRAHQGRHRRHIGPAVRRVGRVEAALELLSSPAWDRHVRTLAAALRDRARELSAAITRERPDWTITRQPTGGLHLWVRLPPGTNDTEAAATARQQGVAVSPGHRYFATEPPAHHLRLSFAATADRPELTEAARRLQQL